MGELAATAHETAIRVMNSLERKKWIATTRGNVHITNVEKMRDYLNAF
jgi:hypothetical protein